MSLQRVDLNLLKVFQAIMEYGSVSGAARHLGVTPSAVSHAIARLRKVLGDELFIYGEGGMAPTARAREIASAVRKGLGLIEDAVATRGFSPADSTRTFRISATDYGAVVVISPLIERLARVASDIEFRIFPYSRPDVVRNLDEGSLDLVIGWFGDLPKQARRTLITTDRESMLVREGHPLAKGVRSQDHLLAFPFVVVELTGSGEQGSDGFLDERGVWRRVWIDQLLMETEKEGEAVTPVVVSLPYYSAVPSMLANTDMIATLPERLAHRFANSGPYVVLDLPYEPTKVLIEAIWHERGAGDKGLQWLLGELASVVSER